MIYGDLRKALSPTIPVPTDDVRNAVQCKYCASAKFASINAIACAEHYIGRSDVKSFIEDLQVNLRSINIAEPSEKYWAEFL
jgi:hypothetical protein